MLRRLKLRTTRLVALCGGFCYLLTIVWFHSALDRDNARNSGGNSKRYWIRMISEWKQIGVGYPQFVLTVTGWVDTIQVDSWGMRPLQVVVVPFSHQDPGWKSTYDQYYQSFTKSTLSLIVGQLVKNPNWKFVWSETVFLERWWNEASTDQRTDMKRLLQNGQLELLGGGWVMPDEASTHFAAILDQMIEGHLWIAETFGRANRSIFCHMMPFLLYSIPHSCGPDRHVCCMFDFDRGMCFKGKEKTGPISVNDSNIASLALELWQQLRKKSELYRSDVVLMPHGDDFRYKTENEWKLQLGHLSKLMGFINNKKEMKMKIEYGTLSDYFTKVRSSKTGPNHQHYPTLTGDFFPYSDRGDQYWSGHYTSRPFHKRMVRALQSNLRSAELLYTFAQAREVLSLDSAAITYEKLATVRRTLALFQHHDAITGTSKKIVMRDYAEKLLTAMTEVENTQSTVIRSVFYRNNSSEGIVQPAEVWLNIDDLPVNKVIDVKTSRYLIVFNPLFQRRRKIVSIYVNNVYVTVLHGRKKVKIQLSPTFDSNNNTVKPQEYMPIHYRYLVQIAMTDQTAGIRSVIQVIAGCTYPEEGFLLSFEAELPPAAQVEYRLNPTVSLDQSQLATVTIFSRPTDSKWFRNFGPFKASLSSDREINIGNSHISATFSVCDGSVKYIHQDSKIYKSDLHFITYKTGTTYNPLKDKSGAYLFLPDGPAEELSSEAISVLKINGQLFSQARTVHRDIIHKTTVLNVAGPDGAGILVENLVSIGTTQWNNKELALRLETDVITSEHQFCTDSNGFQMQRRATRPKFGIQGNFYPMTTGAFLEDDDIRITVLTTEAHGVANLASGMLDFVLDRRLMQDDWRGLNEGVQDNQPAESSFFMMFETRSQERVSKSLYACSLSQLASDAAESFENPPKSFVFSDTKTDRSLANIPNVPALPCSYQVLNLRMFKVRHDASLKEALLILHRTGTDCAFSHRNELCSSEPMIFSSMLPFMDIVSVKEMSITGVRVIRDLSSTHKISIPPMEIRTYKIAFR